MSILRNKKLKFIYIYCAFLLGTLVYIYTNHQSLKSHNTQNKFNEIINKYEIYKKVYMISPKIKYLLIENEDYIDQKELIDEMSKSTPLMIDKKQKQINQYRFTLKYIHEKDTYSKDIEDKIRKLAKKEYIIEDHDNYISLFGRIFEDGFVYMTKYKESTSFINESIDNSFMIIFIFVIINFILFLYYIQQVTNQKRQCSIMIHEFQQLEEDTKKMAFEDTLTKAASRLKLEQTLKDLVHIGSRFEQNSFSVIMLDIDYFKRINDTYGHDYGDIVLKTIASTIKKQIRQSDTFARWGGEEFVILLPITSLEEAIHLAQKLRKNISSIKFAKLGEVTCSFGVTPFIKDDTTKSIMKRVDSLLYKAKSNGRNTVESSLN